MSNVLIVYAHPEPKSLNGSLKDFAVETLQAAGHAVKVSDLYGMKWKAVVDAEDFPSRKDPDRLIVNRESNHAFSSKTLTPDVVAEQEKLRWADAVIFQFPLWWFSMPAIMKGWVDRVYSRGFAYGLGETGISIRYGEGGLKGRRSMISITVGGKDAHYSDRGINGSFDDLLFHIQHGMLFYPGMDVVEPFVVYESVRLTDEQYKTYQEAFKARLAGLFDETPYAYRAQRGGDYDANLRLRPGLEDAATGTNIHKARA
jgi:NAD(P)H dehydrogenase (quinone)